MKRGYTTRMRAATLALLLPLGCLLTAPMSRPAQAAGTDRQQRLERLAGHLGVPAGQLVDPSAFQKQAARKPAAPVPAAAPAAAEKLQRLRTEVAEIERQQAVHTLAGFDADVRAGRKRKAAQLPASVQKLMSSIPRKLPAGALRDISPPRGMKSLDLVRKAPLRQPAARWFRSASGTGDAGAVTMVYAALAVDEPQPADRAPTIDAPSDDPTILARAQALGSDPVRIYNFVHDTIATELYLGSKKGALGTLREGAGNDADQASLLIALLRAAGFDAQYEIGNVVLTQAQAEAYSGAKGLIPASSLLSSAGIPNSYHTPGPGLPTGVRMEHVSVRAFLPLSNYRGVGRPGSVRGWIPLAPAFKQVRTQSAVDLRDAVSFDFDAYLGQVTAQKPSEAYFEQLRGFIRANDIQCETLESAQPLQHLVPANYPILPADLPVMRLDRLAVGAALPDDRRHLVTLRAETSLGAAHFTHALPMASLWGKSVTVTYEAADAASAEVIASHGGIEQTPSYLVRLRPVLKIDGVVAATGQGENPGLRHSLWVTTRSPASGDTQVEHALSVGGVFAFTLDPGLVPADLISERQKRLAGLSGDDAAAEKLHVAGLSYFRDLGLARRQIADLHWHRVYKEIEETMVSLDLRVNQHRGVPVSISRAYFILDAALIKSGNFAIDGDHRRRVQIARLVGFDSSFLEHRAGELFYGPRQFSSVRLLQLARAGGVTVLTFNEGGLDEALGQIGWPAEFEERLADAARSGRRVQASVAGHVVPGLGTLYGYIATDLELGAGEYIVAFESGVANALVHGGVGDAGGGDGGGGDGGGGCTTCGGNGPAQSTVHLLSGNYVDQSTDLTLPARGIPLAFTRTYSARFGWHHNYGRHITANGDGSLTYTDETGVPRLFTATGAGAWSPPPTFFQRITTRAAGGWHMTFPDGMAYDFDAAGRLVAERDLNGNQVTVSYGADGRLATVTGVGGATFTFRHDGAGRIDRVSDSAGRQVTFGYDAAGMLTSETDANNKSRTRGYDAAGRMIRKTNFRGNATHLYYDDTGRIVRIEDAEGGVRSYAYDARNRRTAMTDRLGHVTLWELNASAQPLRVVDAVGNETRMTYDDRGNKRTETSPRGHVETMTYNADGKLLTRLDASDALTTYTYGPHARLATVTDADNRITENTYDNDGKLLTTKDAINAITSYGYGPGGLVTSITRPGNVTTTKGYDPAGNVTSMIDPERGETILGYDTAGHLTSMRDPNGRTRTMIVDAKGQMQSMTDARQKVTRFTYDDDGNRLTVTTPDQAVTTSVYDKLGRLVSTRDPLGNTTRQEYDAEGRVIARIDPRGFRTTMTYDPIGRLVATRDPAGFETRMSYCAELAQQPCAIVDALGNVTTVKEDELGRETERRDPLGNAIQTEYDALGRRRRVVDPAGKETKFDYDVIGRLTKVTDAAGGETVYGYDGRGNRTRVEDANGNPTTFDYDGANRLFRETTPITTATEFGYDLGGNRTRKLDGKAQTTGFVYDENRRLTDINYAGGVTPAHFEYDDDGNRLLERNGDSERHMTYDAAGGLRTVLDVQTGRTITYNYDAAGNRTSMRVTPDNETTTYAWDSRGLLSRMTDPEGGVYRFTHDPLGRRTHTSYPNGMTLDNTYDAASRVLSMVYRKPNREIIESFTYTYDSRGNRTSKIFADGTAELYGYDDLSRLVSAVYPGGRSVQYSYDPVGNRLEMTEGTASDPLSASCPGDADCDGVLDATDNCPQTANPAQTDSDRVSTPAGLAAGYNFEESGSSAQSVEDVTGRNPGEALLLGRTPGRFGGALQFVNQSTGFTFVKIPNSPSLNVTSTALTIAGWVKPAATAGTPLVNKAGVFSVGVAMVFGQPQAILTAADADGAHRKSSIGRIPQDQWSHVAFVYDGLRLRMYINGQLDSDHNQVIAMPARDVPVFIGCNSGWTNFPGTSCSGQTFRGGVDALGIWPRALTQAEIAASMGGPLVNGDGRGDACDACPSNPDSTCAPQTCLDRDRDGYGVLGASACTAGQPQAVDCNDGNPNARPGALEACDGIDNDCDGRVDEACLSNAQRTYYTYNDFNQLLASGPGRVCAGDADCDGHLDTADNCPAVSNATQVNADANTPQLAGVGSAVWWRFEETSGTTAQDVLDVRPGTLQGGVTRTANGRFGRGLTFDGSSGFVRESTAIAGPAQPFTIAAWVRYTRSFENFQYNGIAGFATNTAGIFSQQGVLDYPSVVRGGAIPANQWTHVAYTWNGTNSRLYVNGTQTAISSTAPRAGTGFSAGTLSGGVTWMGDIDEPGLWSRALSAAELQLHAQSAPIGDPEGNACDACPTNPDATCRPATCTDTDGDGYGPEGASNCSVGQPAKFDCDDDNAGVYPQSGRDMCGGVDNDCDGQVDEECPTGTTYDYDGNGNRTRKNGSASQPEVYVFDARDRLIESRVGSDSSHYSYDTRNLRVGIRGSADTTERRLLLDGMEELAEYGSSAARLSRWDRDPSRVDAALGVLGAAKRYAVVDAVSTLYRLADDAGQSTVEFSYDAFGSRQKVNGHEDVSIGFTGRTHDARDGNIHFRIRQYDALNGAFESRDKRLVTSGENAYWYAVGSPTGVVDPTGQFVVYEDSNTASALFARPRPGWSPSPKQPYAPDPVGIGMTWSPSGNALFQTLKAHHLGVRIVALMHSQEVLSMLSGKIEQSRLDGMGQHLPTIVEPIRHTYGPMYLGLTHSDEEATNVCGESIGVTSYWFPKNIIARNVSLWGKYVSSAEVVAHELAHAEVAVTKMGNGDTGGVLSDVMACETQRRVHEELYGGVSTGGYDSYIGCRH